MSYLSHVVSLRPMLRVTGEVLLSGILLCSATGVGVYEFRRLRPAGHTLNDDRSVQHAFNSAFVVALQAANTVGKRGARNRQRHCCGKEHRHRSKQSEYIAIHEPVPRLALIESVYHPNRVLPLNIDQTALWALTGNE